MTISGSECERASSRPTRISFVMSNSRASNVPVDSRRSASAAIGLMCGVLERAV
jgi:hypothetical protein